MTGSSLIGSGLSLMLKEGHPDSRIQEWSPVQISSSTPNRGVITFESIFIGLEQQLTNVTASVTRSENNIQKLSNDLENLSKEQKALESFDENKRAKPLTDRIDKLQKDTDENIRK